MNKIASHFAAIVTAGRYAGLHWHSFAKYPGGSWVYLGALTQQGASNTCAMVRRNDGRAFMWEYVGQGQHDTRRWVSHVLQQLNSGANDE